MNYVRSLHLSRLKVRLARPPSGQAAAFSFSGQQARTNQRIQAKIAARGKGKDNQREYQHQVVGPFPLVRAADTGQANDQLA